MGSKPQQPRPLSISAHQKLVLMFGLEHGRHLLQVDAVPLLLQLWRKEDGDDSLSDVGQVEVVVALHHALHHAVHTEAPDTNQEMKVKPLHSSGSAYTL